MSHARGRINGWGVLALVLMTGSLGLVIYGLWEERQADLPVSPGPAPPAGVEVEPPTPAPETIHHLDEWTTDTLESRPLYRQDRSTTSSVVILDTITTAPSAQISGFVSNEMNEPVAGAELFLLYQPLLKPGNRPPAQPAELYREIKKEDALCTTKSEQDGFYVFGELRAGRYDICVEHPQYAPSWETGVILLENETLPGVDIRLETGLRIEGRVQDADGHPVAQALIRVSKQMKRLITSAGGFEYALLPYRYEESDDEGRFTLERISSGEHLMMAMKRGYVPAEITKNLTRKNAGEPLVFTLLPASRIGGIVLSPDNQPLAGARVTLKALIDSTGAQMALPHKTLQASTDAGGRFTLSPFPKDSEASVLVEMVGFTPAMFERLKAGSMNNRLQLTAGATIAGGAYDLDTGEGVGGLKVVVTRLPKPPDIPFIPQFTQTAQNGRYQFSNLPEGTYRLAIESKGWLAPPRDNISLKANQTRTDVDFEVYRPMILSGRVISADTERGISGALVKARGFYGPALRKSREFQTTTDESGVFTFRELMAGQWRLTAEAAGFFFNPQGRSNTVWLKQGEPSPADIVLVLEPAGELTGVVYTPDGWPVPGATVVLDYGRKRTTSDADGGFEFNGINVAKAQSVRAYAWKSGYAPAASDQIILSQSQRSAVTEIYLEPGFEVEGLVVDEDDNPIAGATVRLIQQRFQAFIGEVNQTTKSDMSGRFQFVFVAPGDLTVSASAENRAGASRRFTLTADGDYPALVLKLRVGHVITGVVQNDRSEPLAGVRVTAVGVPGLGNVSAQTDEQGGFEIKNLREGAFPLDCVLDRKVNGVRYVYRQRTGKIPTGSPPVFIVMPMHGAFEGAVYSAETLEPVPSFTLEVNARCPAADGGDWTFGTSMAVTSGRGVFYLPWLPTGLYGVKITATGFVPATRSDIRLESPNLLDLGDVFLEMAGGLKGVVIDSVSGEGVTGARVTALPDSLGRFANTDYSGFFQITGLARGNYALRVTSPTHLPLQTQPFVVTEGEVTDVGRLFVEPGASLRGRVVDGRNQAAPGVRVSVRGGRTPKAVTTDADGYFSLDGLDPGVAEIEVSGRFGVHRLRRRLNVTLSAGLDNQITIVVDNTLSVTGDVIGDGFWQSAAVSLFPLDDAGDPSGEWELKGQTEDEGTRYAVRDIQAGRYLLAWRARMLPTDGTASPLDVRWLQVISVASSQSVVPLDLGQRSVSGVITAGGTQEPVPGVTVRLVKSDLPNGGGSVPPGYYTWEYITGDDGVYEFQFLPPGRYRLTCTASDERQFTTQVQLSAPSTQAQINVEF